MLMVVRALGGEGFGIRVESVRVFGVRVYGLTDMITLNPTLTPNNLPFQGLM